MLPRTFRNPRKVPAQARSRDTYRAILEAAAHILEVHGIAGVNTNAIAERAGVSIGSLYQFFPDKDAIFTALVRESEARTAELFEQAIEATTGLAFEERLRLLVSGAVRQQLQRPALDRILDQIEGAHGPDPDLDAADARIVRCVGQFLEEHSSDHRRANCDEAARDVLVIVKALMDRASAQGEADADGLILRVERSARGYLMVP